MYRGAVYFALRTNGISDCWLTTHWETYCGLVTNSLRSAIVGVVRSTQLFRR